VDHRGRVANITKNFIRNVSAEISADSFEAKARSIYLVYKNRRNTDSDFQYAYNTDVVT